MSDASFEVHPPMLRAAGQTLSDAAGRFLDELDGFEARMQSYGEPWGNDDIGSLIGIAYTEVSAYIFDCVGMAMEEIESAGGDVAGMADAYEQADSGNAENMESLAGGLE